MSTSPPEDPTGPANTEQPAGETPALRTDPRNEFTASLPWTNTTADCLVLCCSDHRFARQNREFARALGFEQAKFIQIPSGVAVFTSLVAAAGFLHKGMGLLLDKAIELTGVKQVICIGHEDCGGYRAGKIDLVQAIAKRFASKPVREIQIDHLEKAGRTISRQLGSGIEVSVYYADVVQDRTGDRVKYSPVGTWTGGRRG